MTPLESVPNVSEGRDRPVVDAIAAAFGAAGARVVDVHLDGGHNRSVLTLLGDEEALVEGLVRGTDEARRWIDLRRHEGAHPRVGAADVVPVVPLAPEDVPRAVSVATAVARRVGEELELPVFLYGLVGEGRRPAFYRRGGLDELARRVAASELAPSYGPARLDPRSGAVLVGVRPPLVAFNLELHGPVEVARDVARAVRESSGGLPGVQALGLALDDGRVQVSTNLIDLDATPLHAMVERIVREAELRGARVGRGELVGLVPARCVVDAARSAGVGRAVEGGGVSAVGEAVLPAVGGAGLPTEEALAAAARVLRLERLEPDRVLEWHLAR